MRPIAIESDIVFDEEQFKEHLIKVCDEHHQQGRALAFAFIVYDFEDYTITKVLKDHDYWSTLDKIAGKYLTVFYINSQDSYFKERQKEIYLELQMQRPETPIHEIGHMFGINPQSFQSPEIQHPATPLDETVYFIRKEFGLDEAVNHPFIIFFQIKDKKVIDFFFIELKQEQIEDAFLELKNQIVYAVNSIKKVTPVHYKNYQEIFNLIRNGVKDGRINHYINKSIVKKIGIGNVFSLIKIIFGQG